MDVIDMSFFRRLGILVLFCLLGNPLSLAVIGIVNRMTGCIRTVFLLYPAHPHFTRHYAFDWFSRWVEWRPALLGFFRQNGSFGLLFCISTPERDLLKSDNEQGLRRIHDRIETLRHAIGVRQKTFAGILPGVLVSRGILSANPPENRATVMAVQRALNLVRKEAALAEDTPLVVPGAYRGGIPCCASWLPGEGDGEYDVIIERKV